MSSAWYGARKANATDKRMFEIFESPHEKPGRSEHLLIFLQPIEQIE